MDFVKARKSQAKARVALTGPTGAGKTYSALTLATGMAKEMGDAKIVVIDTEHGSAAKYSDLFDFSVPAEPLKNFSPGTYVEAIKACEDAGFDIIIVDSLSHAWVGKGGALEMKDSFAARSKSGNTYTAWAKVTPEHNRLMDKLVESKAHIIATMRSKMSYVQEKDDRGRTQIRRVGLAPVQRDGVEYEFDVICDIDREHKFLVEKTRWADVDGHHAVMDEDFGRRLVQWLTDGDPVEESESLSAKETVKRMCKEQKVKGKDLHAFMVSLGCEDAPKKWTDKDFSLALEHWGDISKVITERSKIAIN
jgi:hypothetical protein